MFKFLKRISAVILAISMLVVLCGGCAEKSETSIETTPEKDTATTVNTGSTVQAAEKKGIQLDPSKKVTIKFFSSAAANKTELDLSLADFNKLYPNITVEPIIMADDFPTKVKTAIVAGEQVDVIEVNTGYFERAAADNIYVALDDYMKRDGFDIEKEFGGYYKQFMVNGKSYALPKYLSPAGVWYNKKHFEEAGIPEPTPEWTWDDFFATAKKLTQKDANGKVTRYGAFHWNFQPTDVATGVVNTALYGGYELLNDDGTPNIDDPRLKKSIEYFYNASMVDKSIPSLAEIAAEKMHYMYDMYKGRWSMLVSGRNTAMFMDTHRMNGQLLAEEDDAGIYKLAYMPRWDSSSPIKQSNDTVIGDVICKNTKNPEEAYTFIKWHVTKSLELSSKVAHRLPASKTLDNSLLMENWRNYSNKDKQVVQGKDRKELFAAMLDPEIKPIFSENYFKFNYSKLVTDELNMELTLIMSGEVTVDKGLADAKASIQKIYEKEKSK